MRQHRFRGKRNRRDVFPGPYRAERPEAETAQAVPVWLKRAQKRTQLVARFRYDERDPNFGVMVELTFPAVPRPARDRRARRMTLDTAAARGRCTTYRPAGRWNRCGEPATL